MVFVVALMLLGLGRIVEEAWMALPGRHREIRLHEMW
jgi:hypothetical protein